PDESGTLCIQTSTSCGFAPTSGSGNYIQNQYASPQAGDFSIQGTSAGNSTATIQGAVNSTATTLVVLPGSSQSGPVLDVQGAAGISALRVSTGGGVIINNSNQAVTTTVKRTLIVDTGSSATVGLIVQGRASQTADLLQLQDSAGTILTSFDASGKLVFGPSGSQDTNLYRSAANSLKTDDSLLVQTASNSTTAFQVQNTLGTGLFTADTSGMKLTSGGQLIAQTTFTNLEVNPSLETNLTGWTYDPAVGVPFNFSQTTSWSSSGTTAGRYQVNAAGYGDVITSTGVNGFPVTVGTTYTGQAVLNVISAHSSGVQIRINWYDGSGALLSSSTSSAQTGTGVKNLSVTAVAPASSAYASFSLGVLTPGANQDVQFYWDSVMLVANGATLDYFDGSIPGAVWNGTAHASTSTRSSILGGLSIFRNTTNSSSAFQVQNATGTDIMNIDSTNSQLSVRGINSIAVLGSELASGVACSGTNWSGTGPWTHTAGSTTSLSCSPPASVTAGAVYQVEFTVGGSPTAGTTVRPNIGGANGIYVGENSSESQLITTSNTNALIFTPSSSFNGTINSISVKLVTVSNNVLSLKNSDNTVGLEMRSGGSGLRNTFVGLGSGKANITGTENVAVGDSSLLYNTTGVENTALGTSALYYNTTGYNNSASGAYSLTNNTTGGENTASGSYSLTDNSTGSRNTATGTYALSNNEIGDHNTASGYNALGSSSTGSYNTATGYYALASNTLGSYNTALGYQAGNTDGGFATLSNLQEASAIGSYAQVQQSNSLVLGRTATGSNQTNVGIGTTAPTNLFSVSPIYYNTGTASQSGTTITGSGTTWTSSMVGMEFIFADGTKRTITAFGSTTSLTVGTSGTVGSQNYRIHNPAFYVTNTGSVSTRSSTNSTTAFQVQNAAGSSLLNIDTTNNKITIGGNNSGELNTWASTTSLPVSNPRAYHPTVTANGYMYVIGGWDDVSAKSTVYYAKVGVDGTVGSWQTNANALPIAIGDNAAVVANGHVYVLGGYNGSYLDTVYYAKLNADGSTGAWQTTTNLPAVRHLPTAVTANGYIYLLGGKDSGSVFQNSVYYAKLNADGTVGSWATTNTFTTARDAHTSVTANGYIYVIGGENPALTPLTSVQYAQLNADGTVGSWSATTALSTALAGHASVVANGYIYAMGGYNGTASSSVYYARLNSNGTIGSWTTATTTLPAARGFFSGVTTNGYLYTLGGLNASGNSQRDVYYTSTQRILMGGSLDLVGLGVGNLSDGESGLGGSLTAGNTNIIGSLDVRGATNLGAGVNVTGNSNFNLLWNTGFNIQDAAGNSMLKAINDPNGSHIEIGHSYLSLSGVPTPVNPTVASANDAGATLAVDTYYYRVASYDISGLQSVAIATTPVSITNPDTTTRHTVSWTPVAGAAGYVVDRSSDGGATFTREDVGNVSSIIDNGITYDWVSSDYAANGRIGYSSSVTLQDAGAVFFDIDNYTYINKNQSRSSLDIINLSGDVQMVGDNLVFQSTSTYQDLFGITTAGEAWFGVEGADSATAFNIQSDSDANLFVVNSVTSRVHIGDPTADANAVQLVLDSKNTSGDPTGVDGAMYYNSNAGRFRCYEAGAWKECNHRTVVRLGSDQGNSNAVADTMEDVTGLSWNVTANTMYSFSCTIYYTSAATTTGSRWAINGPAGSGMMQSEYTLTSTTSTRNSMVQAYDSPGASNASSASGTNLATLNGFVLPTSNGTIIVRHASEVSGSAITAKAGSNCEWW
ncbi:MAG: hypothetical protein AAB423_00005, partial [Patescibacteria group bacterium]